MSIKIGTLTSERREGKATLTIDENGEVRTEEIRISFLKPTEALWRQLEAQEKQEAEEKTVLIKQLRLVDVQSPDITNDDGTIHPLSAEDLSALDFAQLAQLWIGVRDHFFLQTPVSTPETTTNSTSEQASAA